MKRFCSVNPLTSPLVKGSLSRLLLLICCISVLFSRVLALLTNTNVSGNATNVAISDSSRFQNVRHFCFAQFFVVEKCRIGVNIGIESLVDNFALRMDLVTYWYGRVPI